MGGQARWPRGWEERMWQPDRKEAETDRRRGGGPDDPLQLVSSSAAREPAGRPGGAQRQAVWKRNPNLLEAG